MKTSVYLISGLGADERIFQRLHLPNHEMRFVKWITPLKNESIENYSGRISKQIDTKKPIIIGLSFGGMIATEISKQIETEKIILISSAKSKNEIPFYYKLAGKTKLHMIAPTSLLKRDSMIKNWLLYFSAKSNGAKTQEEKDLFKSFVEETDPVLLKWSVDKIVNWKNKDIDQKIFHIHGTNDHVLPVKYNNAQYRIEGGGHLMVFNKADEVSSVINSILNN